MGKPFRWQSPIRIVDEEAETNAKYLLCSLFTIP
jgi:hypothetical protein